MNERKNNSGFVASDNRLFIINHWKIMAFLLILYDILAIHAAYFLALWARHDFSFEQIPKEYYLAYSSFITWFAIACIPIFWLFRMYRSIWSYAGITELIRTLIATLVTSVLHTVLITVFFARMPRTYYLFGMILQFILLAGVRLSYRFILFFQAMIRSGRESHRRVMLIGAGNAGREILRAINGSGKTKENIVCIIDDDIDKWDRYIDSVPVVGGRDAILENVEKFGIEEIYFAIPSATTEQKRDILSICSMTNCVLKQLSDAYRLLIGRASADMLRDVSLEDLLGREPIHAEMKEVIEFIQGKTVLVTGGGGSIGSELCRQIAEHNPKQLIIFDVYENSTYEIELELKETHPELDLQVLIGSVRDSRRIFNVFDRYRPQIVYHAAAHKHVPLMETSPCEAIKNNTIGTFKTAYAAMVHGCERFVLISTDKAVNPTNIMGASKRLCEMIIQSFDAMIKAGKAADIPQLFTHEDIGGTSKRNNKINYEDVKTEFVAVRFGNVLGSNGSVVPLFKKQIEKGGPVTVTDPEIIRYFMTIPEAVSLVMLAGTFAHGGEIFVLDMGSPVKIDTLARNLIRLSGLKPDEDIKIEYTGLRPGEKLYEEKLMAEEGLRKTENDMIYIGNPIPFDIDQFFNKLNSLMYAAYANKKDINRMVAEIVPTYRQEIKKAV